MQYRVQFGQSQIEGRRRGKINAKRFKNKSPFKNNIK